MRIMTETNDSRESQVLIESDSFPFAFLSDLAEIESWRKEIYRPVYHTRKWWANRLGSVFRGILLACTTPVGADFEKEFYRRHDFSGKTVLDPFMGSGTTVGEAHKLGFTAVGCDINPVAVEAAHVAMGNLDRTAIVKAFRGLDEEVGAQIRALYRTKDTSGIECDVLYYFWVKNVSCPQCAAQVDLFSSYIIARHAYAARNPTVQVVCPGCGGLFPSTYDATEETCPGCRRTFDPQEGPARNAKAHCHNCRDTFAIAQTIRETGRPPEHRLYAKLLLRPNGEKVYLPASGEDCAAYTAASQRLLREQLRLPGLEIADGYNTRQVLNYGYRSWREFFNDRQLLALGLLHRAICAIEDRNVQAALLGVFFSALEFNNMFASYKGEGTGAVRHMFSHHILKPERTPIEANVWGTTSSSGAFSTLFKSRLLRCIDYREKPFEISLSCSRGATSSSKVFGCSDSFQGCVEVGWPTLKKDDGRQIFLSCGSSHKTALSTGSIDYVVTDPPFFDNVHYSELADFFYAWQRLHPGLFEGSLRTTRQQDEVQDADAHCFTRKLQAVLSECHRVLTDAGLLVFTYHHSRHDGWISVCEACMGAGFRFVNAHPVKAEMSVAAPKSQAKEPIDIDIVLVCRKAHTDKRARRDEDSAWLLGTQKVREKALTYLQKPRRFSKNDAKILLISQLLVEFCPGRTVGEMSDTLARLLTRIETASSSLVVEVEHSAGGIRQFSAKPTQDGLFLFK
ncbi:MAG: adenine-specific DNA methylase [Planctomycetes bacterium]|nr:adenine-specific DNA methylase [Planctomycetota bacterium]